MGIARGPPTATMSNIYNDDAMGCTLIPADGGRGTSLSAKKRVRRGVVVVLLLVVVGCSRGGSSAKNEGGGKGGQGGQNRPTPVGVATAQTLDVPVILSGLGTITPYNTVTVRSRVDGQLVKVNFREGQMVKSGDLLAVIDPRPFQVALQQAEAALARDTAQYNTAQLDLKRFEALASAGVIAQQQLDQQRAQAGQLSGTLKVDEANIANAKLNLSYTNITAPVTGRVGLRLVDMGNIVHANDPNGMLVITQVQPIAVLFTLPEDQIPPVVARMKQGTLPADAYDRDDKTKLASGKLETLDNEIDPTTGTVRLKAVFDNRDATLWPNQFVNVHLQLQTLPRATVIPAAAVQRGQQGSYVYVVDVEKTAQRANVQVTLTQGDTAVIASGVSPGQQVVVDGQDRLAAGSKVEPTQAGGRRNQNAANEQPSPESPVKSQAVPPHAENRNGTTPPSGNSARKGGATAAGSDGRGHNGSGGRGQAGVH